MLIKKKSNEVKSQNHGGRMTSLPSKIITMRSDLELSLAVQIIEFLLKILVTVNAVHTTDNSELSNVILKVIWTDEAVSLKSTPCRQFFRMYYMLLVLEFL